MKDTSSQTVCVGMQQDLKSDRKGWIYSSIYIPGYACTVQIRTVLSYVVEKIMDITMQ